MNQLSKLQSKFSEEIKRYGITEVTVISGIVEIRSLERIPWELFESIKCELL